MGEAGFPLQFGDGFAGLAGLEGLDAGKNRGLIANWIATYQDTRNGGETQRQKRLAQVQVDNIPPPVYLIAENPLPFSIPDKQ